MRHDPEVTLPWIREGTAVLLDAAQRLPDEALREPSALPGWTRAHVVGHLARNAEALGRLVAWARTGVQNPMYADPEQRGADIESSATQPPAQLRRDLADTAAELDRALGALDGWDARVRSAQGRDIPAAEIPWMRVREVWLHAVDLDAGATMADLPAGAVDTLLDDVTGALSGRDGCPAAVLVATDRDRRWQLGADGGPEVAGAAADLAGWLIGRTPRIGLTGDRPDLPRWL